jgi:hypothetical protein
MYESCPPEMALVTSPAAKVQVPSELQLEDVIFVYDPYHSRE